MQRIGVRSALREAIPSAATAPAHAAGTPGEIFSGVHAPRMRRGGRRPTPTRLLHPKFASGWDAIDYGDLEQGLFLFMLFLRHPAAGFTAGGGVHGVMHYVMSSHSRKPWLRLLSYRGVAAAPCTYENMMRHGYLTSVALPLDEAESPCAVAYRHAALELTRHLDRTGCCGELARRSPRSALPSGVGGHVLLAVF